MAKYIAKRLLYIIFVFFVVSIIMFMLYKAVPGDPVAVALQDQAASMKPDAYQRAYEAMQTRLGLDKPVLVQYFVWIKNMMIGDFGYSTFFKRDVVQILGQPLWNTVQLNLYSMFFVFLITIPLGIATAVRRNSVFDRSVQVFTILGYSLPSFIIAFIFIYIFAIKLKLLPLNGYSTVGAVYSSGFEKFLDVFKHAILPVSVMTFTALGGLTRYVRASMCDVLTQDYIRTARAKGLRERRVIYSHAFRNALISVITILAAWFIGVFGGSVVIESLFQWNGIGYLLFQSLVRQDYNVVMAMQMFYVFLSLFGNLVIDLVYAAIDPRVRLDA